MIDRYRAIPSRSHSRRLVSAHQQDVIDSLRVESRMWIAVEPGVSVQSPSGPAGDLVARRTPAIVSIFSAAVEALRPASSASLRLASLWLSANSGLIFT